MSKGVFITVNVPVYLYVSNADDIVQSAIDKLNAFNAMFEDFAMHVKFMTDSLSKNDISINSFKI